MNSLIRKGLLALFCSLASISMPAQDLGQAAPAEVDEALRKEITAFYTHFQNGEFRKAEDYLDEASKDVFYGVKKNRIRSFVISGIEYSDDFRKAKALVACQTIVPMLGSAPLSVPLTSTWRFTEGNWRMHLVERDPQKDLADSAADFASPFGPMSFDQTPVTPGQPAVPKANATIASLGNLYKLSSNKIRFPQAASPVTRTVTIKNVAQGGLKVRRYTRDIPGIEVTVEPESLAAGQEAEIAFTYRPDLTKLRGAYRIDFMVEPINRIVGVYLQF